MRIKREELEKLVTALKNETGCQTPESLTEALEAVCLGQSLLAMSAPSPPPIQDYPFPLKDNGETV